MNVVRAVALCGSLVGFHARAQAQARDAEALIDAGLERRARREDEAALALFQEAHALSPTARSLAQVGLAEQALGRWIDAEAHLTPALDAADPWIERNRAALRGAVEAVRAHLASVEVSVNVPGASVRINGHDVGSHPLPRPVRVVAGTVALEVRAEGYLAIVRAAHVDAGGLARERFELVRLPAPVTVQSPAPPAVAPRVLAPVAPARAISPLRSPLMLGGGALLVVGGATAVALALTGGSLAREYDARCPDNPSPAPDCAALRQDAQGQLDAISLVIPVALGVAVAGAVLLTGAALSGTRPRPGLVRTVTARGFGVAW